MDDWLQHWTKRSCVFIVMEWGNEKEDMKIFGGGLFHERGRDLYNIDIR